jgi:uncharacterized protein YkwD
VHVTRRMLAATATVVALIALVAAEGAVAVPDSALVASAEECPGSRSLRPTRAQRSAALVCLVNFARATVGLRELRRSTALSGVARAKARDVVTCSDFNHEACGQATFKHVDTSGFRYRFLGENLFYAQRPVGSARDAFVAWLQSPPHRQVMFLRRFSHAGTAVVRVAQLSGTRHVELWVLELAQKG